MARGFKDYWKLSVFGLAVAVALIGVIFWWQNRPIPQPTIERLNLPNGDALTIVHPGGKDVMARVAIASPTEQLLTDSQLLALSKSGSAQIVQVALTEKDCTAQQQALQTAFTHLGGAPTLVSGIGPGAMLAWRWLAMQKNDNAQAVSVGFTIDDPDCKTPYPTSAAHGHWLVDWNDNPDDQSAGLVRDQTNAETAISDYDVQLPQVLDSQLDKLLGGNNNETSMPVVEVPAGQSNDTVTILISGDGGWRDLDRDVANEIAKIGYPVVGVDALRYWWQHKSPEQSAADLTKLMQHYQQKWGTKHFILAGYSFGADVLPAIYNRMPSNAQQQVDGIILLAFARSGSFEIEVQGWLGTAGKEAATGPEMAKLPAAKTFCVYGMDEKDEAGCTEPTAVGEKLGLPGGHHFDENYPALAKRLTDVIQKWQKR